MVKAIVAVVVILLAGCSQPEPARDRSMGAIFGRIGAYGLAGGEITDETVVEAFTTNGPHLPR